MNAPLDQAAVAALTKPSLFTQASQQLRCTHQAARRALESARPLLDAVEFAAAQLNGIRGVTAVAKASVPCTMPSIYIYITGTREAIERGLNFVLKDVVPSPWHRLYHRPRTEQDCEFYALSGQDGRFNIYPNFTDEAVANA